MSASNWSPCPRCLAEAIKRHESRERALKDAYGNIPAEEFSRRQAELGPVPAEATQPETLREDYEIGIDGGVFKVSYSGSCQECDFTHTFRHSETLQ